MFVDARDCLCKVFVHEQRIVGSRGIETYTPVRMPVVTGA